MASSVNQLALTDARRFSVSGNCFDPSKTLEQLQKFIHLALMEVGKNKTTVVISRGEGQLGNRLFQYASFYAASLEKGFRVWNPSFGDYAAWFPLLGNDVFCRPGGRSAHPWLRKFSSRFLPLLSGKSGRVACRPFGGEVLDITDSHDAKDEPYDLGAAEFVSLLERRRFLLVRGWKFRARDALWRKRPEVKNVFRPSDAVTVSVKERLEKARSGCDLLIGIHVRRGDYADWLGGRYFFALEHYERWMREAANLHADRRVAFLVCSNESVEPLLCLEGIKTFEGPGSPIADLYSLAGCDKLLGPPSTFSLWASYWGGVPLQMLEGADEHVWEGGFVIHQNV